MTQSSAAISARGIRKSVGEVDQRTIFVLPGPDGAGKATIVRILSTLIPADAGTIRRNDPAGQQITGERERLTRFIERAAGQDTPTPGRSR